MTAVARAAGAGAGEPGAAVARRDPVAWLGVLAGPAVLAAAVELLVLRTFTRTIIHIPGAQSASRVLDLVTDAGRFSYYLSVVLLIMLLGTLAAAGTAAGGASRASSSRRRVVSAAVTTFAATAAVARAGAAGGGVVASLVTAAVVAVGAAQARGAERAARLLIGAAFAAAAVPVVVWSSGLGASRPAGLSWAYFTAEAAALAALALLGWPAVRRVGRGPGGVSRRVVAAGVVAGLAVTTILVASPAGAASTKTLLLWNLGLGGYLAAPLYGLAVAGAVVGLTDRFRSGARFEAAGWALVICGGIGLHSTYQSGLVVAGLALLALSASSAQAGSAARPAVAT
ncbi:MAG: hypothetical protein KJ056_07125 [Acidimicrobiia bacterium]|nr:hypothetical protein [Acidimicrobiia bacterium]